MYMNMINTENVVLPSLPASSLHSHFFLFTRKALFQSSFTGHLLTFYSTCVSKYLYENVFPNSKDIASTPYTTWIYTYYWCFSNLE